MIRLVAAFVAPLFGVPLLVTLGPAAAPAHGQPPVQAAATEDPLELTIDRLSPSVIPRRGPIRMSGTVTNTSHEIWQGLNVYPFVSDEPITDTRQLELATETDPELAVGERILPKGLPYDQIPELLPGQTARWSIRVPRNDLTGQIDGTEGVYWFGIHVLGEGVESGRDVLADGRARSFLPLIEPGRPAVPTSIVVPLRRQVLHEADGALSDTDDWDDELRAGGRLANLLAFAREDGGPSFTWAVDPAVVDAVAQLAAGNPERDLAPADDEPAEEPEDPSAAAEWLAEFTASARGRQVLALPYGDLDVVSAAEFEPGLLERSAALTRARLNRAGISSTPAVVPPSGFLDEDALVLVPEQSMVLLSDESIGSQEGSPPAAVRHDGRSIQLYDAAASSGGPGPDARLTPLALRQRILAEAALRALAGNREPLVVSLPSNFDPGAPGHGFFAGLDRPFVSLAPLSSSISQTPDVAALAYPERQEARELPSSNVSAAEDLIAAGESLDRLLPGNETIGQQVLGEALASTSYMLRDDPYAGESAARDATGWLDEMLSKVSIDAPSFVILASESGDFAVTITNGLEQPVALKIQAFASEAVIKAPELVQLEAGEKQTIRLVAQADSIGVHQVRLVATDESGHPVGAAEEISIRSNKVGRIIWAIMGTGVGILFLAIVVRLVRRVRRARAT